MGMDLALGFERLVGDPAYLKSKASSVKGISKQGSASTMGMDLALGFERLVGDPAYLKSKASSQSKVYKVLLQRRPVKV
jgi:hypothetical protein